jgi:hypothetical protein
MLSLGEDPVGFKAKYQASRAPTAIPGASANKVVMWLSRNPDFGATITSRAVKSLREAPSYTDARDAALRLEAMGPLTPEILDAIGQAYLSNNQIYPAHVAVPIIKRIFADHGRDLPQP